MKQLKITLDKVTRGDKVVYIVFKDNMCQRMFDTTDGENPEEIAKEYARKLRDEKVTREPIEF